MINPAITLDDFYKCTGIKSVTTNICCNEPYKYKLSSFLIDDTNIELSFNKCISNARCSVRIFTAKETVSFSNGWVYNNVWTIPSLRHQCIKDFKVGDYVYIPKKNAEPLFIYDNVFGKTIDWFFRSDETPEEWWDFLSNLNNPDEALIDFITTRINCLCMK